MQNRRFHYSPLLALKNPSSNPFYNHKLALLSSERNATKANFQKIS